LERENVRLKRLVIDLSLKKQILKDVACERFKQRREIYFDRERGALFVSR
jgi:hypothetical protein